MSARPVAGAFALAACFAGGAANASGLSTARFGGEHGHVLTTNPTAIYYNPAGIADTEGTHVYVDFVMAVRDASYHHAPGPNDLPEPPDGKGANYGEARMLASGPSPMLGASVKIGDLALGLAGYIPMGGGSSWGQNDAFEDHPRYPGPVDGVQRWFAIKGIFTLFYATAAVAYRIEPLRLSLGLSGSVIYAAIESVRGQTLDGSNDLTTETRSLIDASGVLGGFGAGARFEAVPDKVWLAASYTSRPNVAGGAKMEGTLQLANVAGSTPIQLEQDLADIVRFGVQVAPAKTLQLRLFGDWSRWSAVTTQCLSNLGKDCKVPAPGEPLPPDTLQYLRRDWHDGFGLRLGLSQWVHRDVEVMTGLGYDSTAIPDETLEPALPDFHDVSAAVGARVRVAKPVHVALNYTHIFAVSRNTHGKSELVPDSGGSYRQTTGVVNANVDFGF